MEGPDEFRGRAERELVGRLGEMRRRDAGRVIAGSIARAATAAAVILVIYALLPAHSRSVEAVVFNVVVSTTLVVVAVGWQVRAILHSDAPGLRAMEALAIAVTLLVSLFATFYIGVSVRDPEAFSEPLSKVSSLYFTMTTLATVGYGDIVARSEGARIMVMVQMVFNVVVIGVAVKLIFTTARHRMRRRPGA